MSASLMSVSPKITPVRQDRKSTRLNSSHTVIYTLSLHDALPIFGPTQLHSSQIIPIQINVANVSLAHVGFAKNNSCQTRSEEHTSELQSHRDLHSFPTRRSSDLWPHAASLFPDNSNSD